MIVGQGTAIILQTVFFLLLVRVLDTSQFGVFVGVTAFVAIIAPFATLGQGTVLIRRLAQADTLFGKAWGTTLRTALWGGAATGVLGWLGGWFILRDPSLRQILPLLILSDLACNKLVELASQAFQASRQFQTASQISILPNFAKMVAVLCAMVQMHVTRAKLTVSVWTLWYLSFSALVAVAALVWVRLRLGRIENSRFAREDLREGLSYAVSGASFYVYNDIDKTFLVANGFVSAAGFYGAAYRLIEVMTAPLRAVNTAALPRFFSAGCLGVKEVRRVMLRVLVPSASFSLVSGLLVFFFQGLAGSLLGREYGAAGQVLRYLCFIPLIRSLHYAFGNALTGLGSQWIRTSIQIGAAAFNVLVNIYLIPRFSWHGAAASSVATELLLATSMCVALAVVLTRKQLHQTAPTLIDEIVAEDEVANELE